MRLAGRTALVTGAADNRSIGWGIAQALAKEGANIALNDLPTQRDKLAARAADIETLGRRAHLAPADVTDPEQVEGMVSAAVEALGQLDIVVSNAGIIRWENFLDITPGNLNAIVNVNLKGMLYVAQSAARHMIERGAGGRIVFTSSVQSDMHFPVTPVYGGTKHAMHILVGTLALELAPQGITVNHIGPGWVRSALNDADPGQQTADDIEAQRQAVPLKRDGTIKEMGQAVVYFADAAYTTGAFLRVDGGLGISKYSY